MAFFGSRNVPAFFFKINFITLLLSIKKCHHLMVNLIFVKHSASSIT